MCTSNISRHDQPREPSEFQQFQMNCNVKCEPLVYLMLFLLALSQLSLISACTLRLLWSDHLLFHTTQSEPHTAEDRCKKSNLECFLLYLSLSGEFLSIVKAKVFYFWMMLMLMVVGWLVSPLVISGWQDINQLLLVN